VVGDGYCGGVDDDFDVVGEGGRKAGGYAPGGIVGDALEGLESGGRVSLTCNWGSNCGMIMCTPNPVTSTRVMVEATGAIWCILCRESQSI
jgi:hypothetical protein